MAPSKPNWWGWKHVVQAESFAFYRTTQIKNNLFILALSAVFLYTSLGFEPLAAPPATPVRLAVKVVMALMAISMVLVSVHVMPPPIHKPREERMDVMKLVGSPAYLTFWSLAGVTIHCTLEALADLGVYLHGEGMLALPVGPITLDHLGRVRTFCLYLAPFIQGWSIVLTALWLKFNW